MIDQAEIRRIFQGAPGDAVIMIVTFLGTVFLEPIFAVLSGILLSFVLYLDLKPAPRACRWWCRTRALNTSEYRLDAPQCPQLGIVEIHGDLYFGAVSHIEEEILSWPLEILHKSSLLIRMHHVNQMDFSGIHMLESLIRAYRLGGDVFRVRVMSGRAG